MNHPVRRSVLHALALTAALPLAAQEAAPPPTSPPQPKPAPVLVTMSFPGGTLADYVARIRAEQPRANIVVATAAAAAKLPPLELRGAGLDQALDAVSAVAEANFAVRVKEFRGAGEPVYSIVAIDPPPSEAVKMKEEVGTQVFSLNRLTDDPKVPALAGTGFAPATILSVVEASATEDQRRPVLRYHEDSGLLIVRGTRMQVSTVKDVLSNLERDVSHRRAQVAPKSAPAKEATPEPSTK